MFLIFQSFFEGVDIEAALQISQLAQWVWRKRRRHGTLIRLVASLHIDSAFHGLRISLLFFTLCSIVRCVRSWSIPTNLFSSFTDIDKIHCITFLRIDFRFRQPSQLKEKDLKMICAFISYNICLYKPICYRLLSFVLPLWWCQRPQRIQSQTCIYIHIGSWIISIFIHGASYLSVSAES